MQSKVLEIKSSLEPIILDTDPKTIAPFFLNQVVFVQHCGSQSKAIFRGIDQEGKCWVLIEDERGVKYVDASEKQTIVVTTESCDPDWFAPNRYTIENSTTFNPKAQKMIIDFLADTVKINVGEIVYLVAKQWYSNWQAFVREYGTASKSHPRPDEVFNSAILQKGEFGEEELIDNAQFVALSKSQWAFFQKWYGGGPEIRRRVVDVQNGSVQVEVKLLKLQFCFYHLCNSGSFSQFDTIQSIVEQACAQFGLEESSVILLDHNTNGQPSNRYDLTDSKATLKDWNIRSGHWFLLQNRAKESKVKEQSLHQQISLFLDEQNKQICKNCSVVHSSSKTLEPKMLELLNSAMIELKAREIEKKKMETKLQSAEQLLKSLHSAWTQLENELQS